MNAEKRFFQLLSGPDFENSLKKSHSRFDFCKLLKQLGIKTHRQKQFSQRFLPPRLNFPSESCSGLIPQIAGDRAPNLKDNFRFCLRLSEY
jgi:hypothetical protein